MFQLGRQLVAALFGQINCVVHHESPVLRVRKRKKGPGGVLGIKKN
jgi:hypothetical protein